MSSPGPVTWTRAHLLLAVLAVLLHAPPGAIAGPPASLPENASANWYGKVRRSLQLEEYGVAAVGVSGLEFRAANPAHRFESRFDARGVRVTPASGTAWEWGLALTRWGRLDAPTSAVIGQPSMHEDRIELDHETLTEWFVNTPDGLEHGFTVPRPPADGHAPLAFDLALAGSLRPVFAEDGVAIDFFDSGNVSVLRYAKLKVTDATGATLPARMGAIAGGVRITVDDAGAVYPITVDPVATSPSWTAVGESTGNYFGYAVATAGDVNGDGYADVVVGAPLRNSWSGKAYLYLGGPGGLPGTPAWSAVGEGADNRFGYSVAGLGDVNADGYADVIVGAYGFNGFRGKAYLYLGGPGGLAVGQAWSAIGEATYDSFAASVAAAGDANGDGYADALIGADGHNGDTGKAYLYLGGPGGLAAGPAWTAFGEAPNDDFGYSVATAGDVNGDGYADALVGADGYGNYAGRAYLYLGAPGGLATSHVWSADGEAPGSFLGASVAAAGDVDGDGYADVIVGANGLGSGKGYLYLGGPGGPSASPAWTAVGENPGDNFGVSVATAGDVNGDGYADVIVGASGHLSSMGKAYLYLGAPGGLATSAVSSMSPGGVGSAYFGYSVATAGDVNGDGYADLLVGALFHNSGTGKAYLYLGGAGTLATNSSWSALGEAPDAAFGIVVASAGDVNGDGYADALVGAYGQNVSTGKAYLYLGGPGGLNDYHTWSAFGEDIFHYLGYPVATAGDVNGDGYADVLVGASGHNGYTGKAYLYLGGLGGLAASPAWSALGEAAGDNFGVALASAGDVNADGYADVIVGAYGNNSYRGKAYLYLGGPGGLAASPVWSAVGVDTFTGFGGSVATAGDINGDGYADVLVGAFGFNASTGRAYLYMGWAGGLAAIPAWLATGEDAGDQFGGDVATAGDVNGDGYADVIVGAAGHNYQTGKAYLYLGSIDGLPASPTWFAVGESFSSGFGVSATTAGDVNNDGFADVLVSADGHNASTGKAYLYLGWAGGLTASHAWSAVGEAASDYFGGPVAPAGDVNGDGFADILVGASGFNAGMGKAYLYAGGGGFGVRTVPQQLRADLSVPILPGGRAYQQEFRLGLTLRSPMGRVQRKLQWQIAPWGSTFSTAFTPVLSDAAWYLNPVRYTKLLALPNDHERYVWRARVKYHPAQSPLALHGPWFTVSGNGLYEADLVSTSQAAPPPPPPCEAPDEETYITIATLDGNGKVVLHYQDPNQLSAVTGYNIYRSAMPTGPWTVIGSNVIDMNAGTPDKQYVDQNSDVGGPWYYKVAAFNGLCGAQGPF